MASKLLFSAITIGGLAAGFSFAAGASDTHVTVHKSQGDAEARRLYGTELTLQGQEQHLLSLLGASEAELAAWAASAPVATGPTWPPTSVAGSPPRHVRHKPRRVPHRR